MILFFLPPVVQAVVGVAALVVGLALMHSVVVAVAGALGVTIAGARYLRSRRPNGFQR
jgi:hypothetical protein